MPDLTTLRDMFMEWAHDKAIANPGLGVDSEEFMAANDINLDLAFKIVRSCADLSWILDFTGGWTFPSVGMTSEGIAHVQALRARRKNPALRAAAVRNGLLHYFYAAEHAGESYPATADFLRSEESLFLGEQFSVTEIDKAAAYLLSKDLIKAVTVPELEGPTHAQVTPHGTDCVEQFDGDVQNYLNRNGGAGTIVTTNIGTFQNSGNAAIGSTNVSQQVTIGTDPAALAEFARVLLAEFEKLSLGDDLKAEVRAALEEIQNEAKAESAPGRLKAAVGKFAGYVVKAGQPVLTAAFMVLAMHVGLPPAE